MQDVDYPGLLNPAPTARAAVRLSETPGEIATRPPLREPCYGLLRCARNDELYCCLRQINPTGKSIESLSTPSDKNIRLAASGKSVI